MRMVDDKKNIDFSKLIDEKIDHMLNLINIPSSVDEPQEKTNESALKQSQNQHQEDAALKAGKIRQPVFAQVVSKQAPPIEISGTPKKQPTLQTYKSSPVSQDNEVKKTPKVKPVAADPKKASSIDEQKQKETLAGKMPLIIQNTTKTMLSPSKAPPEEKQESVKQEEAPADDQPFDIHQIISQAFSLEPDEAESADQPNQQINQTDSLSKDDNIVHQADALAKKAQNFRHQSKNTLLKESDILELKKQDIIKESFDEMVLSDGTAEKESSQPIALSQKDLHMVIDKISKKQAKLHLLKLLADSDDNATASDIQKKLKELDEI